MPALQPAVSRVIDWALSKDPANRPRTGRDLVDALRYAAGRRRHRDGRRAAGGDAGASPVEHPGRETSEAERAALVDAHAARRSPLLLAGAIGSGLLFVGVLVAFFSMRPERAGPLSMGGGGAPAATTAPAGEPSMPEPAERRRAGGAATAGRDGARPGRTRVLRPQTRPREDRRQPRVSQAAFRPAAPAGPATEPAPVRAPASGTSGAAATDVTGAAAAAAGDRGRLPAPAARCRRRRPHRRLSCRVLPARAARYDIARSPPRLTPASASEATVVIEFEGDPVPRDAVCRRHAPRARGDREWIGDGRARIPEAPRRE